ncbi:MAG: phosphopentomutase [Chloroflexi bacterium]|nr:phosphopentomutase [Chloroflexota bacterium]
MDIQRFFVIVLDGVGAGEAPDAAEYGDVGSNSLGNTARAMGGLKLPNMGEIGLGNLTDIMGVPPRTKTRGAYGRMQERSAGKDSINGHWELMGVVLQEPLPTYPDGFPPEVIDEFKRLTGRGVLGNKPASGTEIIKELGEEHMRSGDLIVYTSADSVFQIAAHEAIVPIPELYRYCQMARDLLKGKHAVGRVIARPFIGENSANFKRTERRHDYPLAPVGETMMDRLIAAGRQVYATGKIDDLFGNRGISKTRHTVDNEASIQAGIDFLKGDFSGLIFSNLIEFDMIYGHRNDVAGYAARLEEFDRHIPHIRAAMGPGDIALIVADHGVDPTTPSTDHSREYIPLLVFGQQVRDDVNLGIRKSFSDVAATIAEAFGLEAPEIGTSFLREILK